MVFLTESERRELARFHDPGSVVVYSPESILEHAVPTLDISIILPCYNVAAFIAECLDSLCGQRLDGLSMEIIAVNDGSTDDTERILREYEGREPMLRVITQPNGGPGRARNTGMRASRGRYLAFIDADDRVPGNYIAELYRAAHEKGALLAACGYLTFTDGGTVIKRVLPKGEHDASILIGTPWAKLFARELFSQLLWPERTWYQDTIVAWLVFPRAGTPATTDRCSYEYRSNTSGITQSGRRRTKALDTMYMTDAVLSNIERLVPEAWREDPAFYDLLMDQLYLNHRRVIALEPAVRRQVFGIQSRFVRESCAFRTGKKHRVYAYALRRGSFLLGELAVRAYRIGALLRMVAARIKH